MEEDEKHDGISDLAQCWSLCTGCGGGYLLGSISSAVIVSRIYAHDDVRKYGSKNAGMTNVLRTYGKLPALFTFLGDFLKACWRWWPEG